MKCPNCENRTLVDIDMHSDGFSSDESPVKECGACGLVWRVKMEAGVMRVDIIKAADKQK
ncbi:MAG: hypothetical protein WC156_01780 [Pedobacter sp.]